jgi:glutathione S-transferase
MAQYRLILGSRNYSSWSMRGWLTLRLSGLPFETEDLPAGTPEFPDAVAVYPPARLVPILIAGSATIWDSLAIAETDAERAHDVSMWPMDPGDRAVARSLCAEMHAGFPALREHMPMNIRAHTQGKGLGPGVQDDIDRVVELWRFAGRQATSEGPFLLGAYSLADVFHAPLAMRLRTYGVSLPDFAAAYIDALVAQPHVAEWVAMALDEEITLPQYEL